MAQSGFFKAAIFFAVIGGIWLLYTLTLDESVDDPCARQQSDISGAVIADDPGDQDALVRLDPSEYYFRTAPTFQTSDPRYAWLNTTLTVGIGRFTPNGLGYRIYRID